jgi:hypothetical protein
MGELNYCDSRMAAYRQEVRKLEEKVDGFELQHILRQDNEATDALTQLESSREPPPPGVFTQDLFNPSIRLEEDIPVPVPGISPGEDNPVLTLGTPLGKDIPSLTFEVNSGAPVGPIKPNQELGGEIVVGPPDPDVDW